MSGCRRPEQESVDRWTSRSPAADNAATVDRAQRVAVDEAQPAPDRRSSADRPPAPGVFAPLVGATQPLIVARSTLGAARRNALPPSRISALLPRPRGAS